MEILPVNDLDVALHNYVNKDDKLAFYSCVKFNLEETRNKIAHDSENQKFEEEDFVIKVGECLEDRVKERSVQKATESTFQAQSLENIREKNTGRVGSAVSFSDDDEEATLVSGPSSSATSRKAPRQSFSSSHVSSKRGRSRGRGPSNLKQVTLDAAMGFRQTQRSASAAATGSIRSISAAEADLDSASYDNARQDEIRDSSGEDESLQIKGRKRTAPRGRGRGSASSSKRGRKSDKSLSSIQQMLLRKDDDDDEDDDDRANRVIKPQTRATRNYGALRR